MTMRKKSERNVIYIFTSVIVCDTIVLQVSEEVSYLNAYSTDTKTCSKCNISKPLNKFARRHDGSLFNDCYDCRPKKSNEVRKKVQKLHKSYKQETERVSTKSVSVRLRQDVYNALDEYVNKSEVINIILEEYFRDTGEIAK